MHLRSYRTAILSFAFTAFFYDSFWYHPNAAALPLAPFDVRVHTPSGFPPFFMAGSAVARRLAAGVARPCGGCHRAQGRDPSHAPGPHGLPLHRRVAAHSRGGAVRAGVRRHLGRGVRGRRRRANRGVRRAKSASWCDRARAADCGGHFDWERRRKHQPNAHFHWLQRAGGTSAYLTLIKEDR